jgi:hypothetical protein
MSLGLGLVEFTQEVKEGLVEEDLHGWNQDPSGRHQERYFSGGQPTTLVRDGGQESHDSVSLASASEQIGGFSPSDRALPSAPEVGNGWLSDPSERHQFRYYECGDPTRWVSNGGQVSEDEFGLVGESQGQSERAALTDPGSSPHGTPATSPHVAAGWFVDPADSGRFRYWDGSQWTRHVSLQADSP